MNQVLREHYVTPITRVQIVQGDITEEAVEAIVNAANRWLQHGAGVAGAIVRRGGAQIQAESDAWVKQHGSLSYAEPALTRGGQLPCRFVIHARGPVWGEGDEDNHLAQAVSGVLALANRLGLVSLAIPAISTGIFGFPKERAARIILGCVLSHCRQAENTSLRLVRVCLYDQPTVGAFILVWNEMIPEGTNPSP